MDLGNIFNKEINKIKYNNKINEVFNNKLFNLYRKCTNICILNFQKNELNDKELSCLNECFEQGVINNQILTEELLN